MKLRRWQALLVGAVVLTLAIAVGLSTYRELVRQEEQEPDPPAMEQLQDVRERLREIDERLTELENTLRDYARTYRIVTGADLGAPSRGGRYTALTMPILSPSGFSPARFERAFAGTGMAGLGESLCLAEKETGVNALVLAGVIALESGWGSSKIAREKNNLAGLGAYSGSAYTSAIRFDSRDSCVTFLADLLRDKYLTPGGKYYSGGDLLAVGKRYAEDPRWAQKVGRCMRMIVERAEQ